MAIPGYNNNGPGMFNAHDGQGDMNANSGPGALFNSDKQDIHYTIHHNYFYAAHPSDLPRDMPCALSWHSEPSTSHADQRRYYTRDPLRSQTENHEPPPHHSAESTSFRPLSSIAASVARVPDPSNRYSTGRRSFPQTYNYHDRDDEYIPDYISRRGPASRPLPNPPTSPGLPSSDYRHHQQPAVPPRSRTARPRPASPILKRSNSGLSNLSRTSATSASSIVEPPVSPRTSSPPTSLPSRAPPRDVRKVDQQARQLALAQFYKARLSQSSMGHKDPGDTTNEPISDQAMGSADEEIEALRIEILREVLAYPVNQPAKRKPKGTESNDDVYSPSRKLTALMTSGDDHPRGRDKEVQKQEQSEQPPQSAALSTSTESDRESIPTSSVADIEHVKRDSVSSISSSVVNTTSNTSGGTAWSTSMSPMSALVLYASAGVLGYHTPFLIQSGILYLREFTMLHGSILRVFYMYESILCLPLLARSGLLFK